MKKVTADIQLIDELNDTIENENAAPLAKRHAAQALLLMEGLTDALIDLKCGSNEYGIERVKTNLERVVSEEAINARLNPHYGNPEAALYYASEEVE